MSQKLENAKRLYLEGIRDGNIEAVKKYSGERYTQHSTGVGDGPEGFMEFFKGFLKRTSNRDIRIIRAIEDGNYVFVHVYQDIDNGTAKWVTTDMFDTDDNDKLIEHWDVIAPYQNAHKNIGGTDIIFGDFQIKDEEKTEENKALIRSFLVDVFQNGNHDNVTNYISSQEFINRNPNISNGVGAFKQFLANQDFNYDFIFKVIGQGDHVVSYAKATLNGEALAVFDIFRIEDGKIVEHWDNMEPIPPRSEWTNSGKF